MTMPGVDANETSRFLMFVNCIINKY
jgi:hypothetical protein